MQPVCTQHCLDTCESHVNYMLYQTSPEPSLLAYVITGQWHIATFARMHCTVYMYCGHDACVL